MRSLARKAVTPETAVPAAIPKKVKTETLGDLMLNIPRDRKSDFEPQLIPKGQRMSDKLEEAIMGLYSRGMTTSDISEQVKQAYGVDVSEGTISMSPIPSPTATGAWQSIITVITTKTQRGRLVSTNSYSYEKIDRMTIVAQQIKYYKKSNMENTKEGLKRAIRIIKSQAALKGNIITDEDIASKVHLSKDKLFACLNDDANLINGLVPKLLSLYGIQSREFEFRVNLDIEIPNDDEEDSL